jgi:hypothetical protein
MIPALSRLVARIPISTAVLSTSGLVGRVGLDGLERYANDMLRKMVAANILKRIGVRNETGSEYVIELVAVPPEQVIALVEEAYAEGYKGGMKDARNLG